MAASTLVATDCDHFPANLRALRTRCAAVADQLTRVTVPPDVQRITARDGSTTYRLSGSDGQTRHLGRATVPAVRAAALLDTFKPDGANVLVPAFGTGLEVHGLLARTASHCAVFVHESDGLALRLALTLTDFTVYLNAGRLVFLDGPELGDALVRFFDEHPGYEFPQRVFAPPYLDSAALESIRAAVQRVSVQITQSQRRRIQQCAATLAQRRPVQVPPKTITILTIDPRPTVVETADALADAAGRIDLRAPTCMPDRPDRCHSFARIQALVDHHADAALLVNCGWGPLREFVPDDFPAVTWLLPGARLIRGLTDGFGPRHVIFVGTPDQRADALAAGAAEHLVRTLEIAVDDRRFAPRDPQLNVPAVPSCGVAVIADLPDVRPAALQIDLDSHVRLWRHLCEIPPSDADLSADVKLARAERNSGVELADEHLRRHFLNLIATRLTPALQARAVVEALLADRVDVRVYGAGWERINVPADRVAPAPSTPEDRNAVYHVAGVVICPVHSAESVRVCLEAVTAGGCAVLRTPAEPLESAHPQLADALQYVPMANESAALARVAAGLAGDDRQRRLACSRARNIIHQRHLWSHRWAAIRDALADASRAS